ncbi:MAG: exodeoxyribonuclease VII large subunit [Treponemataceae bacterium]|nr:exodeoxyribonuclease VII large subunit [Treponemataceae bacterium]
MQYLFNDETEPLQDAVYTVSQITGIIKDLLENSFSTVTIQGEISNWKPSSSGHVYFTLKDETAVLSAVMFKSSVARLTFQPKEGTKVTAKGRITVYPARGNYQIIVSSMECSGDGAILKMLEERKRRLAMEGLFDSENKKMLPRFPRTVGVVTSPTGAALRDIMNVTRRRNPGVNLIVLPAAVQGAEAAPQIAAQIMAANHWKLCDVLIVGRGGGSLEDLLPFSEEIVVRAVAASDIPVVSAVGHEIDWAISDYAADVRAPTPSAAAELCTPVQSEVLERVLAVKTELVTNLQSRIERIRHLMRIFDPSMLEMQFRTIEQPILNRFDDARDCLERNMKDRITETKTEIQKLIIQLEAINPQAVLDRGYSMVTDSTTGAVIRDADMIPEGTAITIRPQKGIIQATVHKKEQQI